MKIAIIIGSTRPNRFSEHPARWLLEQSKNRHLEVELLDLRDYPLPFFDDPISPSRISQGQYANPLARTWAQKIDTADGFIIVTPEYNHGYPAVLKNALDFIYQEWARKPVGFVAYGSVGGARAVEQLRQVAVELQMVPLQRAIHIPGLVYRAVREKKAQDMSDPYESLKPQVDLFFEQLLWWAQALKAAREKDRQG